VPVSSVRKATGDIHSEIISEYGQFLQSSGDIEEHISTLISDWEYHTTSCLAKECPFIEEQQQLDSWRAVVESGTPTVDGLKHSAKRYLKFCKSSKRPSNESFWTRRLKVHVKSLELPDLLNKELPIDSQLLLNGWQKSMDQVRTEWEFEKIGVMRGLLLRQLRDLLGLLQELHDQLKGLGLDPGLLLDLSKGELTAQDIDEFKRWAKYLAEDEGVRSLCELLGKMRQIEISERIERVTSTRAVDTQIPDIDSREEIVGIRLGKDIEYALPSELALLSDPVTSLLFDLKYVESRLMCFDMEGIESIQQHQEFEQDVQVEEEDKQGPMVICVDTSGSMGGMPETVAKAVALYMASKARENNRPCYLINFSTGIETLDFGNKMGMKALLKFLKMSFHGGTDAAPALHHALTVMNKDAYKKADLLVISDFIMGGLSGGLHGEIEKQRECGNRFYSLVVGSVFMTNRLNTLFDQEWVFDPRTSRVQELVNFQRNLVRDRPQENLSRV
jgi:uncharacterized protein with von Willebrand factor type A (vWA) domain